MPPYVPGGVYPGGMPPYVPGGVYQGVYTLLCPPGYTVCMHVYHTQGVPCAPLPGEEALGSEERIVRKERVMRRIEPSLLP